MQMKRILATSDRCSLGGPVAAADERCVNIFNWSDYVDPGVQENFTRETGVKRRLRHL